MFDHPVLDQLVLGYSPIIDRQHAVVATRLTLYPARPDAPVDAAGLSEVLQRVWPAPEGGSAGSARGALTAVSLNLASESLLRDVLRAAPRPQFMLEVPAFMANDPDQAAPLQALRAAGVVLLFKGPPQALVPPAVQACFSHAVLDAAEDRCGQATAPSGLRQLGTVRSGIRSQADADAAFGGGALAVQGWPFDDAPPPTRMSAKLDADIQVVVDLLQGVDRQLPVAQLEAVLKRDPALAFRLLRHLNSPAFGLGAEVTSFGHAIMMLGYGRLKRWLALVLASSGMGAHGRPLRFAAVRRGLLMEELGRSQSDTQMRDEMFICGVFSLLDRLLQRPLGELLDSVPVAERVRRTLMAEPGAGPGGPYTPYLALVGAIERESLFDIRDGTERLLLSPGQVNRALLAALRLAQQFDA
jgi:EAL and modified HD-GYP domain-containing signal transduction protein